LCSLSLNSRTPTKETIAVPSAPVQDQTPAATIMLEIVTAEMPMEAEEIRRGIIAEILEDGAAEERVEDGVPDAAEEGAGMTMGREEEGIEAADGTIRFEVAVEAATNHHSNLQLRCMI
jgi:hypothetical protein